MNKSEQELSELFLNRERTLEEKDKLTRVIENFLISKGGIVLAISCRDGILLVGVSPVGDQTIFKVFDRIGLLGLGKTRDYKAIHKLALSQAWGMSLNYSKADVNAENITEIIVDEIDRGFSYLKSPGGVYKAGFVIAELGFEQDEDFIGLITYVGGDSLSGIHQEKYLKIYQIPIIRNFIVMDEVDNGNDGNEKDLIVAEQTNDKIGDELVKEGIELANKDIKKNEQENDQQNLDKKTEPSTVVPKPKFQAKIIQEAGVLALEAINALANNFYSENRIWSVKEAALFIGIMIRLLDVRGGNLEMIYLDREMLKKTKTEKRRFHHIWQRITNPNLYKQSDSWEDWKKFVTPVRRKIKKGDLYPDQKIFIELFEILEKEKEKDTQKFNVAIEHSFKIIDGLLSKQEECNGKCKK